MSTPQPNIRFGTCTWSYSSWLGLIYSKTSPTAAGYLNEYAQHYNTVEIDSWFYRLPIPIEASDYKKAVGPDFRFTCKVPRQLCLTHFRGRKDTDTLEPNPNFLSPDLWNQFLDAVSPLQDQIAAYILEFEYLNLQKMPSLQTFIDKLGAFFARAPQGLPYALEPRNSNFLKPDYFKFIQDNNLIHVLSEKIYMPHIYDVYEQFKSYFPETVVIRLLGNDRQAIEAQTGHTWNKIVDPKPDRRQITRLIAELAEKQAVYVNVNNHYEGSAPLTIRFLQSQLSQHPRQS